MADLTEEEAIELFSAAAWDMLPAGEEEELLISKRRHPSSQELDKQYIKLNTVQCLSDLEDSDEY